MIGRFYRVGFSPRDYKQQRRPRRLCCFELNVVSVGANSFDFFWPTTVVVFFATAGGAIADKKIFRVIIHIDKVVDTFSKSL